MWRSKERDEYIRSTLHTVPYLPAALRANAAATNVDGFFEAFFRHQKITSFDLNRKAP